MQLEFPEEDELGLMIDAIFIILGEPQAHGNWFLEKNKIQWSEFLRPSMFVKRKNLDFYNLRMNLIIFSFLRRPFQAGGVRLNLFDDQPKVLE